MIHRISHNKVDNQNPPPDFPDDDMDQPPVRFHCYHQDLHVSPDAIVIPPNIPDEVMVHSQKRPFDGHDPGSKSKARPSQMPTSVVPVPPSSQPSNYLGGDVTLPNQISNPQPESIQTSPQGIKRKSDKHGPEDEEDDDDLHDPTATPSGLHDTEPEPYHGPPILPYEDAENDPVVEQNESDNAVPYEDSTDTDQTQDYSDLYVDESQWSFLTQEQKLCSNTGSFTVPRLIDGTPVQVGKVQSMNPHMSFTTGITVQQRQARRKTKSDIMEEYYNLTEEDKAFMTLYSVENASSLLVGKKRKEATEQEKRELAKQFLEAKKAECQSWLDNEVFDLVDMRKLRIRNFVSGRWVLTTKRDKDGNFVKCKARWVLKGFQDKQKNDQETDSPAASRNGFRCATQHAANQGWNFFHMDLKTAFLQGEHYDESRDILCQIPPEYGYPPYMGARMKKPAYGLNDAPRKWWNVVDKALLSYGLVPTRADRCTYVLYGDTSKTKSSSARQSSSTGITVTLEQALQHLMDPVSQNNCQGRSVHGFVCLHVDDLFMSGDRVFENKVMARIRKDFAVGSEDKNDVMFVGQRICWKTHDKHGPYISIDQKLAVDSVEEIKLDKSLKDSLSCTPQMHTAYRSALGQLNWLQSRTQVHLCYKFSRCASAASSPTIGDVRELNKTVRTQESICRCTFLATSITTQDLRNARCIVPELL